MGFSPKKFVIIVGMNELKSYFCAILSHQNLCQWIEMCINLTALWLSKYPSQATSILVNGCLIA